MGIYGQAVRLVVPLGHERIEVAVFSYDNGKVITMGDSTIRVWDALLGKLLGSIKGTISEDAFNFNNKDILIRARNGKLRWLDISTLKVTDLHCPVDKVVGVQTNTNGERIAALKEGRIEIWDIKKEQLVATLPDGVRINSMHFSADGKSVMTVSKDTLKVWDVDKATYQPFPVQYGMKVAGLSADKKRLLIYQPYFSEKMTLWDVSKGVRIPSFGKGVSDAQFSADGKRVIALADGRLKVLDAATGKQIRCIATNIPVGGHMCLNRAQNKILITCDTTAGIWDMSTGKVTTMLYGAPSIRYGGRYSSQSCFSSDWKKLLTIDKNVAYIWDTESGQELAKLEGRSQNVGFSNYSPRSDNMVNTYGDKAWFWDANTGNLIKALTFGHGFGGYDATTGHLYAVVNGASAKVYTSPSGSRVVTTYMDDMRKPTLWDSKRAKEINELKGHLRIVTDVAFSPDEKWIVTCGEDGFMALHDGHTGEYIKRVIAHHSWINSVSFSPDSKLVITTCDDGLAMVWDIETDGIIDLEQHTDRVTAARFSPKCSRDPQGGRWAVTASVDNTAVIWDLETKKVRDLLGHTADVISAEFSPDGKRLVTASSDRTAKVWDVNTGALLFELNGHEDEVHSACFSSDGRRILTSSGDNTMKIWDARNKQDAKEDRLVYTFFIIDSNDYFKILPNGYYQCSPNAAKLCHFVTEDMKVISFEQLDVRYNRPDKVLTSIGCTNTALINTYYQAYADRIDKLGIDTLAFNNDRLSVPTLEIVDRDGINEHHLSKVRLHVKAADARFDLKHFNVWVNENPLFGLAGISIKHRNSKNLDTTITVALSKGDNIIEASVTNVNGIESYHEPFVVLGPAVSAKEQIWFIGMGIDSFREEGHTLKWSTSDIINLEQGFKSKYKDGFHSFVLLNRQVTVDSINAMKQVLKDSVKINDKVIIAFSGHGVLSEDSKYYLSTYDMDFKFPAESRGMHYDMLAGLLDGVPARKKLLLIDACHSGELYGSDTMIYYDNIAGKKGDRQSTGRSVKDRKKLSAAVIQELFVNVARGTGTTVIAACAGAQYAHWDDDLKAGIFTYSILELLRNRASVTINEFKDHVIRTVSTFTDQGQVPTTREEARNNNWKVW